MAIGDQRTAGALRKPVLGREIGARGPWTEAPVNGNRIRPEVARAEDAEWYDHLA